MPSPKIYKAQEDAAAKVEIKALVGNRRSAQRYADRITGSEWWRASTPGFWNFSDPAPERVWVWEADDPDMGGMVVDYEITHHRGREFPTMILGHAECIQDGTPAIADKWVILHELAHVQTNQMGDGHHGKHFCMFYILLVNRWIGRNAGRALMESCKEHKIRLDYKLTCSLMSC